MRTTAATRVARPVRALASSRTRTTADQDYAIPRTGSRMARASIWASEQILLLFACAVALLPLYAMVIAAFKTNSEFNANPASLGLPSHWTLSNFSEAWSQLGFASELKNTLVLSIGASVLTTAASVLAGYVLARLRLRGSRWILIGMVVLMSVPAIVVIVPLFELMSDLGLVNTIPAAIIAEAGLGVPFGTYLVFTFMTELPEELFQAAQLEGASAWQRLILIAVPLSLPAIVTVALITWVVAWNDLLVPLILWPGENLRVLMVGLANLAPGRQGTVEIPLAMAGVTISVIPVILIFLLTRRFFVRGLVEGSLK